MIKCLQRKKFEIRAVGQPDDTRVKLTLFSGCDDKSKLLLALCRDTHLYFRAIAPRVNEAKQREEEGIHPSLNLLIPSLTKEQQI